MSASQTENEFISFLLDQTKNVAIPSPKPTGPSHSILSPNQTLPKGRFKLRFVASSSPRSLAAVGLSVDGGLWLVGGRARKWSTGGTSGGGRGLVGVGGMIGSLVVTKHIALSWGLFGIARLQW